MFFCFFMTFHIPEDIIEEIQSRCDIVEVINGYIPLKRTGSNFKALCPFHNEKTPSFVVSPSKQIYHCFGCSAGGNVLGFVMQYEHLDFVDAVKLLADRTGVIIPLKKSLREESGSKDLWDVNKFAAELFHGWLYNPNIGKQAYSYLKGRNIKDEVIKKYLLGYAPNGNPLLSEAGKRGFSSEVLLKAGLVVKTQNGVVDMFRNRLMFPIFNALGKPVGFSGRVLDNSLPKYINTPETALFHKGKILYGLHISKSEIIKEDKVIICEGYFDFLRAYQEGVQNIVASQGTAFTIDHVHLLRRYASSIVVSFDGDTAGDKASLAGLDMFLEQGLQVKILEVPKGYDPDTFIKEKGVKEFHRLLLEAKDILDTKLDRLSKKYPIATTDGKLKIVSELLPDISNVKNEIYKRQFIKQTAVKLGVPEESIWLELKRLKKPGVLQKQNGGKSEFITEKIFAKSNEYAGEKHLVQLLMDCDVIPQDILDGLVTQEMAHNGYKTIMELIIKLKKSDKWKGPSSLMGYVKDDGLLKTISQLAAEEIPPSLDKERIMRDCIYDIKKRYKENKIKDLISKIEKAEKNREDVSGLIKEVNSYYRR